MEQIKIRISGEKIMKKNVECDHNYLVKLKFIIFYILTNIPSYQIPIFGRLVH